MTMTYKIYEVYIGDNSQGNRSTTICEQRRIERVILFEKYTRPK